MTSYKPPDDLDRLAASWAKLLDFVNVQLPRLTGRATAAAGRVSSSVPTPKKPS